MENRPLPIRVAVLIAGVASLVGALVAVLAVRVFSAPDETVVVERYAPNTPSIDTRPVDAQEVLARVEPSVVCLAVVKPASGSPGDSVIDHATGMVVTSDGTILTNHHVVRDGLGITVTLHGFDEPLTAVVIADDPNRDMALIRIKGDVDLPTVTFGDSDAVEVGDAVLTIGNALGLDGHPTVTSGIVSATGRSIDRPSGTWPPTTLSGLIQTDAPINGGASGGPLVSSAGEVIGMNTIVADGDATEDAEDIGFAIPSNDLKARVATWLR